MFNNLYVKDLLKERGKTATELIEALGLSSRNFSLTKVVGINPTAQRIEAIADFLEIPIDDLFVRKCDVQKSLDGKVTFKEGQNKYIEAQVEAACSSKIAELEDQIQSLKDKIKEKELRIRELEGDKDFLKKHLDAFVLGRISDDRTPKSE